MAHSLRPCLKRAPQANDPPAPLAQQSPFPFASCSLLPQRVHFPPAPALTSTHLTHSSNAYDRAPIVVAPNVCALPARNERTYMPPAEQPRRRSSKHHHAHASSAPAAPPAQAYYPGAPLPPLVPDVSSESDESDTMLPGELPPHVAVHFPSNAHVPIPYGADGGALAFLPHPPPAEQERGRKRSPSRARGHRSAKRSEFAAPELDGCLGGF